MDNKLKAAVANELFKISALINGNFIHTSDLECFVKKIDANLQVMTRAQLQEVLMELKRLGLVSENDTNLWGLTDYGKLKVSKMQKLLAKDFDLKQ